MKIILTTSMSGLGGTEHASFRLGSLLQKHGHQIVLASSHGPLVPDALTLGMTWHNIDFYKGGHLGYLKSMVDYGKMLKQEQPDIIHCQMARVVPACAIAAKLTSPKTKVFYHARGLDPKTYPKIAKLFNKLGVYIIGNCHHEQQKLIRYGFPANRIRYTYNALPKVETVPEKTLKNYTMLGTLSRLDKHRDVAHTINIFKMLVDKGLSVRLQVAGIGQEFDNLKAQAEKLKLSDKITFLGGVRDLYAYFRDTDILLNTPNFPNDHSAGVGNNTLEAGLYHTPVVCYNSAGISEIVINGKTGYCLPFHDTQAFADAVETLVKDPDLRKRYGDALNTHVTRLCSDEEIYRTTLAAYNM